MTVRRALLTGSLTVLLVACGGDAFTSTGANGGEPDGGAGDGGATGSGSSHGSGGKSGTGAASSGGRVNGSGGAVAAGGGTSGDPISEADFRTALTSAYCDLLVGCCSANGITLDGQQCNDVIGTLSGTNSAAAPPGTYTYDGTAAAACLSTLRGSLTSCDSFPNTVSPCTGVYTGTLAPGAQCSSAVECARDGASTVSCSSGGDGGKVCQRKRRVASGDACNESCREQGPITYCSGNGVTSDDRAQCFTNDGLYCANGICRPQAAVGSSCTDNFGCLGEAKCRISDDTCVPLGSTGNACSTNADCKSTLYCSAGICTDKLAVGAACTSSQECASGACANDQCSNLNLGISLVCTIIQKGLPTSAPTPTPLPMQIQWP